MKVLWISLLLFALLLGITVANAVYVRSQVSDMRDALRRAESAEGREEAVLALEKIWEANRMLFGFSAGARRISRIETLMTELAFAYEVGAETEFQKARLSLLSATEELIRYETVSVEAIF